MNTSNQNNLIRCNQQCNCNCGTRISLDEQLINEREEWKQKYFCLQKQTSKEVGLLKQKIYHQCSSLMQAEFNKKQKQHSQALNKKNYQIQELTSRIIKLETAFKVSQKEKEVLRARLLQQEQRFNLQLQQLALIKRKHTKQLNQVQEHNFTETGTLKVKITQQHTSVVQRLQSQNEHLKHKLKQFQRKYQAIIPQVEKLKQNLMKKSSQFQMVSSQLQRLAEAKQKQILGLNRRSQELREMHAPCLGKIAKLSEKVSQLQNDLIRQKGKAGKKQIRVQAVYIDRPVQVQRVVQRIIQVQRIVKEYIQPDLDYRHSEQQNGKLKAQLQSIITQLLQFQARYSHLLKQNQQSSQQYQQTIDKYKSERQTLVKRIHEQDEELDNICKIIQSQSHQQWTACMSQSNPEKIVVQVNKDGTYNKRIERIAVRDNVNLTTNFNGPTLTNNRLHQKASNPHRDRIAISNNKATKPVTQTLSQKRR